MSLREHIETNKKKQEELRARQQNRDHGITCKLMENAI